MSAVFCPGSRVAAVQQRQQAQHQTGWLVQHQRQLLGWHPTQGVAQAQDLPSRLSVRPAASGSGAAADLATYHFAQRHTGVTSEWFQSAVRDIVKHIDEAPMLQTVQLDRSCASPLCNTYTVHESVVAVPELWQSIAEHVSQHSPDVVILVQRVSPSSAPGSPQGAMAAAAAADQQRQQQQQGNLPGSPRLRSAGSIEMRVQAEEACRRLVSSGVADAILLHGQVGDCCDGSGHPPHDSSNANRSTAAEPAWQQQQARPLPLPSIVPFSPSATGSAAATRRSAVRTAALRPVGSGGPRTSATCQQSACYWGVVVQSRKHTGAEGCYLLKTVKNVSAATGCTCTHFSLTRISQGDHLEQQFVQSWLI